MEDVKLRLNGNRQNVISRQTAKGQNLKIRLC